MTELSCQFLDWIYKKYTSVGVCVDGSAFKKKDAGGSLFIPPFENRGFVPHKALFHQIQSNQQSPFGFLEALFHAVCGFYAFITHHTIKYLHAILIELQIR